MYLISHHQLINSTEIISSIWLVLIDRQHQSKLQVTIPGNIQNDSNHFNGTVKQQWQVQCQHCILYSCHFVMHGRCLLSVCIVSELRV